MPTTVASRFAGKLGVTRSTGDERCGLVEGRFARDSKDGPTRLSASLERAIRKDDQTREQQSVNVDENDLIVSG